MIHKGFPQCSTSIGMVSSLQGKLRDFSADACVATPWNGMAIARRSTLPCTPPALRKPHTSSCPTAKGIKDPARHLHASGTLPESREEKGKWCSGIVSGCNTQNYYDAAARPE